MPRALEPERADLGDVGDDRLLVAAVADLALELLERLEAAQRARAVGGLQGDVVEGDSVVELEGRVAEARRVRVMQLLVHRADQGPVLLPPVGLQSVPAHDLAHPPPPGPAPSAS